MRLRAATWFGLVVLVSCRPGDNAADTSLGRGSRQASAYDTGGLAGHDGMLRELLPPGGPGSGTSAEKEIPISASALRPQHGFNWCWAASGEMLMELASGKEDAAYEQCEQANRLLHRSGCCPQNPTCDRPGWPQFTGAFTFLQTHSAAVSWPTLVSEIDAGRPIAYSWHWLTNGVDKGYGHMVLILGYRQSDSDSVVVYLDPMDPSAHNSMSYAQYAGADSEHSHWDDFYHVQYTGAVATPPHGGGQ